MTKKINKITLVGGSVISLIGDEYFVTFTDKKLSGWGCAEGRKAKVVVVCANRAQAYALYDKLTTKRGLQLFSHASVRTTVPRYPTKKYHTSFELYTPSIYPYL